MCGKLALIDQYLTKIIQIKQLEFAFTVQLLNVIMFNY